MQTVSSKLLKSVSSDINRNTLIAFFKELETDLQSQFDLLSLRPKRITSVESYFHGDFDFIIRENEFTKLVAVIYNACKNQGIHFILNQKSKNKKLFTFFITNSDFITCEFWT
ncbi:MAG: hypothetical protein Q8K02_00100, partial [Flavobacterium sp.]|nr:hypothetical protein [Flavobacterium sp.]